MADKYPNFDALAAGEVSGVDYRIIYEPRNSSAVSHIAIHGGKIEGMTSNLALETGRVTGQNGYGFEGIQASNNFNDLHITSTHFDEQTCLSLQNSVYYTVSYHGAAGTTGVRQIFMGGADTANRDAIKNALIAAGFSVSIASNELNGDSPDNITQKNRRAAGVQIEFSAAERDSWLTSGSRDDCTLPGIVYTDRFFKVRDAIAGVTRGWETGAIQTKNYKFNLARETDSMANFETYINANLDKITASPPAPSITGALPQTGTYSLGDRIYRTDDQSVYILICKDSAWGWFWRPIQAAISPWLTVPATAIVLSPWSTTANSGKPLQIALDNRGMCHWRGVLGVTTGSIAKNTSIAPFASLPFGFRPRESNTFLLGHQTLNVSTGDPIESARIFIPMEDDRVISVRTFGGDPAGTNITQLFFDGVVSYALGTGLYTSP